MTERDKDRLPALNRPTFGTAGLGATIGVLTHGVLPRVLGSWGATEAEREMREPGIVVM